ncbi:23S rRNA (adenine(2503)-C(2))-methyltransferase RlmN [Candidatus Woesearchaeota archaeon]|nr:MAG: 23S rRNA (adenine(2503)-C(2))-methyltransferase RlmN [Candidatus Woesearchaeota archaeon]
MLLNELLGGYSMRFVCETVSKDGTRKYAFRLKDGRIIESVLIFHKRTTSACLSSQVGCAMGCSFCATGKMGFSRNLSTDEIVGQFDFMSDRFPITNVVFMGMGEPLHNYDNVVGAIRILRSKGLSWRKITVSTVGIPDRIRMLGRDEKCMLALSLHAPDDELRSKIVKVNDRFPISELVSACKDFPATRHSPIMIEYVMLSNVNDSVECAKKLAALLSDLPFVMVNLIPFNPSRSINYSKPSDDSILAFKSVLISKGFKTIIRTAKGVEDSAACGQLAANLNS